MSFKHKTDGFPIQLSLVERSLLFHTISPEKEGIYVKVSGASMDDYESKCMYGKWSLRSFKKK